VKYEVRIIPSVEKEMDKLTTPLHKRISRRILSLEDEPRPRGVKKLSRRDEYLSLIHISEPTRPY